MRRVVRHWEGNTVSGHPRPELVSAFLVAPLLEEAIFRVACMRLAAALGIGFRTAALGSAALFGLMHLRFGGWFAAYAGVGGLVLWATYGRTGYWGAVLLHASANLMDLSVGWRRYLRAVGASGAGTARTLR